MNTWTTQPQTTYNFSGTDGAGASYAFSLVRSGAGPQFVGALTKNGASQGQITFDNVQAAKDLFDHVSGALPSPTP